MFLLEFSCRSLLINKRHEGLLTITLSDQKLIFNSFRVIVFLDYQ